MSFDGLARWVRNHASICAFLAIISWFAAAVSCVVEKMDVDRTIADSYSISAIQIQQLNGSLTNHMLLALALATALTVPLLVAAVLALSPTDVDSPDGGPVSDSDPFPVSDGTF